MAVCHPPAATASKGGQLERQARVGCNSFSLGLCHGYCLLLVFLSYPPSEQKTLDLRRPGMPPPANDNLPLPDERKLRRAGEIVHHLFRIALIGFRRVLYENSS